MSKEHLFISYCQENEIQVQRLYTDLKNAGEAPWWNKDILGGKNWKSEIKLALENSYAVICCFSEEAEKKYKSGIYPEIRDAIEIYRQYSPGSIFIIPVRLSTCIIPDFKIDSTTSLQDLEYIDLFPQTKRKAGIDKIIETAREAPDYHP